jgi:hypothetical protein
VFSMVPRSDRSYAMVRLTRFNNRDFFLRGSCRRVILKTVGATRQLKVQFWSVNQRAAEAEGSPSLRFVTGKRVEKTLQKNSHFGELLQSKD